MYRRPITRSPTTASLQVDALKPAEDKISFVEPREPQMKRAWFFFILILLAVIVITFAVRHLALAYRSNRGSTSNQNILRPKNSSFFQIVRNFVFRSDNLLEGQRDDRINILLLGMGGPGHDGPYLTDTNIIVSIKPSTKETALISIPRDLGVKIGQYGWRKINNANSFGELQSPGNGGDYARQIFAETFNLNIPYYIRVDFKAFQELIDEVDGVTINVPKAFTDTEFPGPNYSYRIIHFDAGVQTLNGERALEYSRSRHGGGGEGSDFARSRRQQLVLAALKEKLLSLGTYTNPVTVQKILESLSNHVTTNLDFAQLIYLAGTAKDITQPSRNLVLDSAPNGFLVNTTGESGAFMLAPKTGNFTTINEAIENVFSENIAPTSTSNVLNVAAVAGLSRSFFSAAKIEIQNGTWRVGLANRTKKQLEEKGFAVLTVGNSLKRPLATTTIYILNQTLNKQIPTALSQLLPGAVTTTLPEWLGEAYDNPATSDDERGMKYNRETDALIMLGDDMRE